MHCSLPYLDQVFSFGLFLVSDNKSHPYYINYRLTLMASHGCDFLVIRCLKSVGLFSLYFEFFSYRVLPRLCSYLVYICFVPLEYIMVSICCCQKEQWYFSLHRNKYVTPLTCYAVLQLKFATVDLELHSKYVPGGPESIYDVDRRVSEKTQVIPPLPEDRFLCSFSHIFAGWFLFDF